MRYWGAVEMAPKYLDTCRGQWRRSQVKSGKINIEKIEGVGSGEGLCPPQLGAWGLAPEKIILR